MSSVDDRVVGMRFNNSAFERGVRTTMGTLDKLKKSLDFSHSTKSMNDLESAASRFHMGNMSTTISGISGKLLAMGTIGVTALANITNRAVDAGIQLGKSLTIDPILQGFHEYETTLGSIQTILANTGLEGDKGLNKVNDALNQLNTYSDKTIYNFSEMARNIGTFTAAGVDLDTSVMSIKGIANLAAISGSNSQQASTAMYQLSQALAAGSVKLQDWNSVVNAGMGGKVFQEALFNTAKQLGTIKDIPMDQTFDQWKDAGNTFRTSLQDGFVTADVLTQTLSQFTGDLTDAQLKSKGYTDEQIAAIQKQAKVAQDAATKVKTITQLMDTLKEAVGSGWTRSFTTIFGNFTEARDLWTDVSNTVGGMIQNSAKARNKILSDWKALGGRTVLIEAVKKAFADLGDILSPIKKAFHDIFPPETGKGLYDLTVRFRDFMNQLALGEDTMVNLRRTFRGVFAVFDILWQVIKGVAHVFGTLFSAMGGGSGSFLNFTGNIGDMLVAFDEALKKGGALEAFFNGIGSFLAVPMRLLGELKDLIFGLFEGFDPGGVTGPVQNMGDSLSNSSDVITGAWDRIVLAFKHAKEKLQPIIDGISNFFSNLGHKLGDAMGTSDFEDILKLFNTVLLGGITLAIKKFLGQGLNVDIGNGFLSNISSGFQNLSGTLSAMQMQLKAKALLEIAGAIALLTASVVALSFIKPKKIDKAVKALAVIFAELLGAMTVLGKLSAFTNIKIPLIAAAMLILAGAVLILTLAVKALSKLNWEELKKGLVGVGVLLAEITGAAALLSLAGGSMVRTGASLVLFALGIKVLASAVEDFSKLDWQQMLKGLVGVGGALAAVAIGMKYMPKGMFLQGAGLLAIGVGLESIAAAVKNFASLKPDDITKGLVGVGLALGTIAGAMHLMPAAGMVAQSAAILLISFALQGISRAVAKMGALNWKTLAKGLISLAGALAVLAGAMKLMKGSLGGAIAMGVAAASLLALAPALKILGTMSWEQIIHGLVALAGALGILAGISALLSEAVGPMLAFGTALLVFSAAVALAGAGVFLLGHGLGYLADHGAEGISTLLEALDGFISRLPEILSGLANGLVQFVLIIGRNAPKMIGAMGNILQSIMQAIIDSLPKVLELFIKLIDTFLTAVEREAPKIVRTGLRIVVKLLQGIAKKVDDIVTAATDIVTAFLGSLAKNLPRIVEAGFKMVIAVLHGIADSIRNHEDELFAAGGDIVLAIIQGILKGIWRLAKWLWSQITGFFSWLWHKILGWFGISSPSTLAMDIGINIVKGIWEGIKSLATWLWNKLTGFLGGIWDQIMDWAGHIKDGITSAISGGTFEVSDEDIHGILPKSTNKSKPGTEHAMPGSGGNVRPNISPQRTTEVANAVSGALSRIAQDDSATVKAATVNNNVTYEQNNYSPKPLSSAEIYRQTKNQLVLAKGGVSEDAI